MDPPADATTLIYMGKANAFYLLDEVFGTVIIPPTPWREAVDAGRKMGAPEVRVIAQAEKDGILQRVALPPSEVGTASRIASAHGLGRGEAEVLALGTSGGIVLIDEARGTAVAEILGYVPISVLLIPILINRAGRLGKSDAEQALRDLGNVTNATVSTMESLRSLLEDR